jgi:site-specific recombinase XerD
MTNDKFTNYLNKKSYRQSSVSTMLSYIKAVNKELNLQAVTYTELIHYLQQSKAKGNKRSTLQSKINTLRHYLAYLVSQGEREENPALLLELAGKKEQQIPQVIKEEELEEIYNKYPAWNIYQKRDKVILGLIIYQGITSSELNKLSIKAIDLSSTKIHIPSAYRSNKRNIQLQAVQLLLLQEYIIKIHPLLQQARNITSTNLIVGKTVNITKRIFKTVKTIYPQLQQLNQLRISRITIWINNQGLRKAQYLAGHKYVSSTEKYQQIKLEDLQSLVNEHHPLK